MLLTHHITMASGAFELLFIEAQWMWGEFRAKEHAELRWVRRAELSDLLVGDLPMVEAIESEYRIDGDLI